MPGIEIKGRSKIANYRHGGRTGKFGGGRTNLLEELGRVEAEPSNRNRRAEISRVHGELNRGYAKGGRAGFAHGSVAKVAKIAARKFRKPPGVFKIKGKKTHGKDVPTMAAEGGRIGFKEGTPKFGGAAKKRKIEQTKAVKRLTTSDKAYSPKKLIVEAFKRRGTKGAGTGTSEAITDWHNIREEAKKVQKRLPGSSVTVRSQEERFPRRRRRLGKKSALGSPYRHPRPRQTTIEGRDTGKRIAAEEPLIEDTREPLTRRKQKGKYRSPNTPKPEWSLNKWGFKEGGRIGFKKGTDRKWIQKAVDPKHKGYCTPMTKKTCTPARKALARTFKKKAKTGWS